MWSIPPRCRRRIGPRNTGPTRATAVGRGSAYSRSPSRLAGGGSETRTAGPPRAETARGFRGPARYRGLSSRCVSAPFYELGPAGTDQTIGIFVGHLDDAILSDGDASA